MLPHSSDPANTPHPVSYTAVHLDLDQGQLLDSVEDAKSHNVTTHIANHTTGHECNSEANNDMNLGSDSMDEADTDSDVCFYQQQL